MQGPDATTVQAAAATLLSARAAYTALLAPPSADEIARLEADLHNAQATLQQAGASRKRGKNQGGVAAG